MTEIDDGGGSPRRRVVVNAARLWAGGFATAVVAGLVVVVGLLICRSILHINVLGPWRAGALGTDRTTSYIVSAFVIGLAATALLHLLLLLAPQPIMFYGWIIALGTLAAVLTPFASENGWRSQASLAVINLVVGLAVGTLLPSVARGAVYVQRRLPPTDPATTTYRQPPMGYR
jgi:hypothetical protein